MYTKMSTQIRQISTQADAGGSPCLLVSHDPVEESLPASQDKKQHKCESTSQLSGEKEQ